MSCAVVTQPRTFRRSFEIRPGIQRALNPELRSIYFPCARLTSIIDDAPVPMFRLPIRLAYLDTRHEGRNNSQGCRENTRKRVTGVTGDTNVRKLSPELRMLRISRGYRSLIFQLHFYTSIDIKFTDYFEEITSVRECFTN